MADMGGQPQQDATAPLEGAVPRAPSMCLDRLRARWEQARTLLCVGLDPEIDRLPLPIGRGQPDGSEHDAERRAEQVEEALLSFNQAIIDATADLVCAFKPNSAFYEAHGPAGMQALVRTIAYIHDRYPDVPVILDVKRGDIGSTSRAYARAAFDAFGADAVTLQPYVGREALDPFLERGDRGCFILCRTSNPGSGELQDMRVRPSGVEQPLYVALARRVASEWNGRGNCGLVVGATYPEELRQVRTAAADLPILVPGIGAQGGDLEATLRAGLDGNGTGLIISASRSVLYASNGPDYATAARAEAQRLWNAIDQIRATGDEM
jgi:orotidine-5'-phosphate decarboxylase